MIFDGGCLRRLDSLRAALDALNDGVQCAELDCERLAELHVHARDVPALLAIWRRHDLLLVVVSLDHSHGPIEHVLPNSAVVDLPGGCQKTATFAK